MSQQNVEIVQRMYEEFRRPTLRNSGRPARRSMAYAASSSALSRYSHWAAPLIMASDADGPTSPTARGWRTGQVGAAGVACVAEAGVPRRPCR
jgi:hypothetical protein